MPAAVFAEECADRLLRLEIEAERGLVEKEHLGLMQQRRRELALHPLAERELAHGLVDEIAEHEELDELRASLRIVGERHAVYRAIEPERLLGRQIPEQLLLVAEHEGDALAKWIPAGPRIASRHLAPSPSWGRAVPVSILSVVVFPAPLGPRNATASPRSIANDTLSTARTCR